MRGSKDDVSIGIILDLEVRSQHLDISTTRPGIKSGALVLVPLAQGLGRERRKGLNDETLRISDCTAHSGSGKPGAAF